MATRQRRQAARDHARIRTNRIREDVANEYAGTAAAAAEADADARAGNTETGPAETPPDPRGGGSGRGRASGGRTPQGGGARRGSRGGLARGERWFDRSAREAGRISVLPPRRLTAKDTSGFVIGLFCYVLALNYVRHGPEGVRGWLAAKFINKPWTPPGDADDRRKREGRGGPGQVGIGGTARAQPADDRGGLDSTRPAPPVAV